MEQQLLGLLFFFPHTNIQQFLIFLQWFVPWFIL